jgi:GNAT superfamily N-acetyltransferase
MYGCFKKNYKMPAYEIKSINHGTPEYDETVKLRDRVLRKPLGLVFTPEQLAAEDSDFHLAYYENGVLLGCLVLVPHNNGTIQMRQVAVDDSFQNKGIGKKLVIHSETFAKEKGFHLMWCHARDIAVVFYKKQDYHTTGDMFEEVTIPHFRMEKKLV